MFAKPIAAAIAGLCLMWGAAHAGTESVQERSPAAAVETPEAVGATNDTVVLEVGPAQRGASAEEAAAAQMLLLQFLMMQSEDAANPDAFDVPRAPSMIAI